jgi:hypothetical protein
MLQPYKWKETMNDVDILTKIIKWAKSTTYVTKNGTKEVNAFAKGYERGINDAKARILEIINSKNE